MGWMADERGLDKCAANYVPLTPLSWLKRARKVYPDVPAVVYGSHRKTYAKYHARVSQLASALAQLGLRPGDVVATMIPNLPAQAEAHFGVPACGAVLNTINTRLEPETVAYILDHGEAKAVMVDTQFLPTLKAALPLMTGTPPTVIEVPDDHAGYNATGDYPTYEDLLTTGDATFDWIMPQDEWESISLNYTSGTTGRPKGVVYHHRGAYLNAMGQVLSWQMTLRPKYLTIVPLFHCNGWCHTWLMPSVGGTIVCCRDVTAKAIYDAIADEGVTHFGGAPIVLKMLVNADDADRRDFNHTVQTFTAGAPPAPAILEKIGPLGFNVTQVYGLTETYGPATESYWDPTWDALDSGAQTAKKARQGVEMPIYEDITVVNSQTQKIPADGVTQGEIVMRGNGVMKGYLKNPEATAEAFKNGYFHSGDLALLHPDDHIQIADRAKDIIISGGENISSVEVEGVMMAHPDVLLCAVVAKPDDKWGEVPCAFVELKEGTAPTEADLITFTRSHLAGFKTPKRVVFTDLPKTNTGKVQKFELRAVAKAL